jgi:FkbM family methyltransferase
MTTIFHTPKFLISDEKVQNMNKLLKIFYFLYGFFIAFVYNNSKNLLFTKLINLLLKKNVKLYFEDLFYIAVDGDLKIYYSTKRVTRALDGIMELSSNLYNQYLLNYVNFSKNDIFIDCGSNVGELFYYFNENNISIKYIAFEPEKEVFDCLSKNVPPQNSLLYNLALSNDNGKKRFYLNTEEGDSSLTPSKNALYNEVETSTLDSYNFLKIKVLKIDAEGNELEVLQGATETLTKTEYVSVDFGPEKGEQKDKTIAEVTDFLYSNNFKIIKVHQTRDVGLFQNKLNH